MLWAFKQLGVPLRYLVIRQGDGWFASKATYDFLLPILLSLLTVSALYGLGIPVGFLSDKGIVVGIVSLLNLVIAFFIAALAAVATFDRKGLDDVMKGRPALLKLPTRSGEKKDYSLTNRQFVCYLFGYLSFVSLFFLISIHFVRLFGPELFSRIPDSFCLIDFLKLAIAGIFFFVLWQIVVTMFLGIYFLCDRLQFMDNADV